MNIFVAKINYSTDADSLQRLFEAYGEVDSAKIIMDRDTGRSKGFGFVEMPNDEEGMDAISELNETEFEGSTIVVKKANPRNDDRGGNRGGGRGGFGGGNRGGGGGYGGGGGGRRRY
jgi:RNA recognition motif-containing protein